MSDQSLIEGCTLRGELSLISLLSRATGIFTAQESDLKSLREPENRQRENRHRGGEADADGGRYTE